MGDPTAAPPTGVPSQVATPPATVPAAPATAAPSPGAVDTGTVAPPTPPATGGDTPGANARPPVPYERFEQVVQQRNRERAEHDAALAALRQRQEAIEQQVQGYGQHAEVVDRLRSAFAPPPEPQFPPDPLEADLAATKQQVAEVRAYIEARRKQEAGDRLLAEIQQHRASMPVPDEMLPLVVAVMEQVPNVTTQQAVKRVSELSKGMIDREVAARNPPAPANFVAALASPSPSLPRPKNLREAHAMARQIARQAQTGGR